MDEYESLSHPKWECKYHGVFIPKQAIGYIKGESAIHVALVCGERKRNFEGQHFWGLQWRQGNSFR